MKHHAAVMMCRRASLGWLVALCVGLLLPSAAWAHKSNIGLLDIREKPPLADVENGHRYTLNWSFTGISMQEFPTPAIPPQCQQADATRTEQRSGGVSALYSLSCDRSLVGHEFRFLGQWRNIDQLVLLFDNGQRQIEKFYTGQRLRPVVTAAELSAKEAEGGTKLAAVSGNFFVIGFEHMILGWDHLLFLLCLLMLTGMNRRIVMTVTGFTLGHSVTLLLAARDVISLPTTPVEILIALSIVYMAAEVWRQRQGHVSVFSRYPVVIASLFGLLHGLGFSSALDQLAFSEDMSLAALLLFNIGIEAAQLVVVAGVSLLVWLATVQATPQLVGRLTAGAHAGAYVMGVTAGYWFIERTVGMLPVH